MKKKLLFISVTTLILLTFAESISSQDEMIQKLLGQWDWVYTTGGIAGMTMTPQTEGYTLHEIFSRDTADSLCSTFLKNDSVIIIRRVLLDTIESIYSLEKVWAMAYITPGVNPEFGTCIIAINDTVLHRGDNAVDGFESLYNKRISSIINSGKKPQLLSTINRPNAERMFFNVRGQRLSVLSIHKFSGHNLILQRNTYKDGTNRILKIPINIE